MLRCSMQTAKQGCCVYSPDVAPLLRTAAHFVHVKGGRVLVGLTTEVQQAKSKTGLLDVFARCRARI